mgnify:CR=1 FL=1
MHGRQRQTWIVIVGLQASMRPKTLYWHGTDHEVLTMTHQTLPPPARRTSQQIANDPLQATALLDQCRNAVDAREGEIKEFQFDVLNR